MVIKVQYYGTCKQCTVYSIMHLWINYLQYIFISTLAVETCNQLVIPPAPLSLPFPPSYPPQHIPPSPHPNQVFLLFFVQHIYWYSFIYTESLILPLVFYLSFSNSTAFNILVLFLFLSMILHLSIQSIQWSLSFSGSLSISGTISFFLLFSLLLCSCLFLSRGQSYFI